MANDEDVARLRQGVAVWNDWRAQNPERLVDLRKAHLRGADLHGANLSRTDLCGAKLMEANLRGVDLRDAILRDAILGISITLDMTSGKSARSTLRRT